MRQYFSQTFAVTRLLAREAMRNVPALIFTFFLPLAFLVLMGMRSSHTERPPIPVALVNACSSEMRQFEAILPQAGIEVKRVGSAEEAGRLFSDARVAAVLDIRRAQGEKECSLDLRVDPSARVAVKAAFDAAQYDLAYHRGLVHSKIELVPQEQRSYFRFVFPGLLAIALIQIGVNLTAAPLTAARESGELLMLKLLPMSTFTFLSGYVMLRVIIGVVTMLLMLAIAAIGFGQSFPLIPTVVIGAGCTVMMIAFGIALASLFPNTAIANNLLPVVNIGMIMGGQVFFDTKDAGPWANVTALLPITPITDSLRQVLIGGSSALPLSVDFALIALWLFFCVIVAVRRFRFVTK